MRLEHMKIDLFRHPFPLSLVINGEWCLWQRAEEAKADLRDFVSYSQQIEAELDKELNEAREIIKRKDYEILVLIQERDKLKNEASRLKVESFGIERKMGDELTRLQSENERLIKEVRILEQRNDDLERELRITAESLKDTEKMLNDELEVRALLTTELESKDELKDQCQRLEDEIRDLKLDISVKDAKILSRRLSEKFTLHNQPADTENFRIRKGYVDSDRINHTYDMQRRKRLSTDTEIVGSRVNALPSPLARNVSPVINNLLKTIQALEDKLIMLQPARRAYENGFNSKK
ncbi:unnamed protein product [Dracunculus medinensis]|uniref:NUDE_C domain-containing protein n=1 Tax=Dracunculus medinensis TaxID=318479 RepID=A0A158Q591_DRAME|nr:unnamed protein product [Dracunculus medinensis]